VALESLNMLVMSLTEISAVAMLHSSWKVGGGGRGGELHKEYLMNAGGWKVGGYNRGQRLRKGDGNMVEDGAARRRWSRRGHLDIDQRRAGRQLVRIYQELNRSV
jgi:hypothetical protein